MTKMLAGRLQFLLLFGSLTEGILDRYGERHFSRYIESSPGIPSKSLRKKPQVFDFNAFFVIQDV
ncbi:hypothetical protein C7T94_11805 [Pedobacter yulinensis]|uniref:Uncharacterized protein n=1 Tax=Pedobacter yulinensis TaxID=2126353 RepID=A0A2T3HLD2_9SPHI|nr:hypothetical protein C7T94_11805 [Pedobacter yulinensis]